MTQWLNLDGKTAVVTGAGSGIGRGVALALADAGCRVLLLDLSGSAAEDTAEQIRRAGATALAHEADTTDHVQVAAAAEHFRSKVAPADILVNNAGIPGRGTLLETPLEGWRRVLDINLTGYLICAREFAVDMIERRHGSIVHVSSICGVHPSAGGGAYSSSKAGVAMMVRQLALELAPFGVRSNAVAPGLVRTPLSEAAYADDAKRTAREQLVPLGRIGTPEDVAEAVLWLASDRSSYVTGQELLVDGGFGTTVLDQLQRVAPLS